MTIRLQIAGISTLALASLVTVSALAQQETRKPNHLLGVQSPYLQQHVYNPVDWYPWGEEALEKAKRENKPIFLSVGYSTCHWCHVMARESFEDPAIGAFLNEHYVSIKIDRERRPDLDEQFMLATQALTGRGGWPNSVFMTSDAKPFYAATYLPPDDLMKALSQIDTMWDTERATLQQEGERITSGIMSYMNRSEAAQAVTAAKVQLAAASIIEQADYFSGGLGTAPKFPQEAAMLLLLDQARRGDKNALDVVKGALDGMLMGGIHDHAGGGFHRYAVDPNWRVPHFEKMLYNQAMIGQLLIGTYELTGDYRYKHTAQRALDYVVREMQSEAGGFYSAQDADSLSETGIKGEGHFYVWSKQEFDTLDLPVLKTVKEIFDVTEDGNFEGSTILHLTSRIDQLAKETDSSEAEIYARLDEGLDYLRRLRENTRHAPNKDRKILVSWNAQMIETMAYAAHIFDRPDYWKSAKASADHILRTMLNENELLRVSYEGRVGVLGQLADYAGLGNALLALKDFAPTGESLPDVEKITRRLADDIRSKFADQVEFEGRVLRMTERADGMGHYAPLDDNPIPSGNSMALQLFDALGRRGEDFELKKRTRVLAATLSGYALASAQSRGTLVNKVLEINTNPAGNLRHVANGNVKVSLKIDHEKEQFRFDLQMKEGWHINSNKPLEEYFIPTALKVGDTPLAAGKYPKPVEKKLKFNGVPLSLYEGHLVLSQPLPDIQSKQAQTLSLDIQACSDQICLEPESLSFSYWRQ
ncbi:MAG: DUF255 domain-containing protein [Rhizobiaceae bacterium]